LLLAVLQPTQRVARVHRELARVAGIERRNKAAGEDD